MISLCCKSSMICGRPVSTAPEPVSQDEPSYHSDSSAEEIIDIKGDQFDSKKEEAVGLNLTSFDMMALGLTAAIGGHFFAWNEGLSIGFGGFFIALLFVSTGYYCLVLCISELSSALPFAGGAYGIARVTLGIYPGYLIAVCDTYKSIIYASTAAYSIGDIATFSGGYDHKYEYGWWLLYYVVLMAIHIYGGRFFWRINLLMVAVSTAIIFIYIFGSIKFADFTEHAALDNTSGDHRWFAGGVYEFIQVCPLASRFFVGIQSINLACGQLKHPKRDVPRGSLGAMTFCMFTSFAVLFLGVSLPPGINLFSKRIRPLTAGFQTMFAIPRDRATLLNLPATFMSGSAFTYFYGQQISAMGKSGLLNPKFGYELPGRGTPVVGLIVGSAVGFALCVIEMHCPGSKDTIYNLSILAATATYLSIFVTYVGFRWYFPAIKREFVSPVGIPGAVYGFLVFLVSFISICGFQEDQRAIVAFVAVLLIASVYYYFVVRKRQLFSEEEKTVMFKAYLVKNNAAKADRIKRGITRAAARSAAAAAAQGQSQGQSHTPGTASTDSPALEHSASHSNSNSNSNTIRAAYMTESPAGAGAGKGAYRSNGGGGGGEGYGSGGFLSTIGYGNGDRSTGRIEHTPVVVVEEAPPPVSHANNTDHSGDDENNNNSNNNNNDNTHAANDNNSSSNGNGEANENSSNQNANIYPADENIPEDILPGSDIDPPGEINNTSGGGNVEIEAGPSPSPQLVV